MTATIYFYFPFFVAEDVVSTIAVGAGVGLAVRFTVGAAVGLAAGVAVGVKVTVAVGAAVGFNVVAVVGIAADTEAEGLADATAGDVDFWFGSPHAARNIVVATMNSTSVFFILHHLLRLF